MDRTKSCESRIDKEMQSTLIDLRRVWELSCSGSDEGMEEFNTYGLSFDYVPSNTFDDQEQGYFRYQLSWGGPSDEFRFYIDPDGSVYCIEYWFLDWFDGAHRTLEGGDKMLLIEIFNDFEDMGIVESELEKAREEMGTMR